MNKIDLLIFIRYNDNVMAELNEKLEKLSNEETELVRRQSKRVPPDSGIFEDDDYDINDHLALVSFSSEEDDDIFCTNSCNKSFAEECDDLQVSQCRTGVVNKLMIQTGKSNDYDALKINGCNRQSPLLYTVENMYYNYILTVKISYVHVKMVHVQTCITS